MSRRVVRASGSDSRISRRLLLRGAGAALALPWLEAMWPSSAAAIASTAGGIASTAGERPPVRLGVLFMPNGVHPKLWTPSGRGSSFDLSQTLSPLADFQKKLLVLTNLWNAGSRSGDGHYVKTAGFLTCTTIKKTIGFDLDSNGVSMDQVAASAVAGQTPLRSLELGVVPVSTGIDRNVGYTRVYGSHISWSGPSSPLAKEIHPHLVYERLFRAGRSRGDIAAKDKLLLDRVLEDARSLKKSLGSGDCRRIDEYLAAVRSIEERLARESAPSGHTWTPRAAFDPKSKPPQPTPDRHQERVRLMLDMIALAFQTDSTRVATFMFGNSVSNENFSFLGGVKGAHHSLSHHENKESSLRQYAIINRWHIEQYAYLLRKLEGMSEGDSTVLDNSMILFGSGIRDGNRHDPHNLPIVLAGRAGGRIQSGQHLAYDRDTPLSNLYLAMLDAFGVPSKRFADSTEPLRGVLDRRRVSL